MGTAPRANHRKTRSSAVRFRENQRYHVIRGNHDINNPEARSYDGSAETPVANVSAAGSFVFDIETGSTVTWPCPIRHLSLSLANTLDIAVTHIEPIDCDTPPRDI